MKALDVGTQAHRVGQTAHMTFPRVLQHRRSLQGQAWRSLRLITSAAQHKQTPKEQRAASSTAAAAAPRRTSDVPPPAPPKPEGATKLTALSRYRALVLDSTYQPIDVVNWQRAICLEMSGTKVDVLSYYEDITVKAPRDEFLLPAVMRVRYFSKRAVKHARVALNRHNIFLRDNFQCQYCGAKEHLTLDHVVPSCLGGGNSWENLVTCCSRCNSRKGSKTLAELKWKLRSKPREPSQHEVTMMAAQWSNAAKGSLPPQWDTYLAPFSNAAAQQHRAAQ